jgi:hypothetical protein
VVGTATGWIQPPLRAHVEFIFDFLVIIFGELIVQRHGFERQFVRRTGSIPISQVLGRRTSAKLIDRLVEFERKLDPVGLPAVLIAILH